MDGEAKAERVAKSLFADYYSGPFDPSCFSIVGSYAKGTAAKPRSDIDMIFVLPDHEFYRFNNLAGNKQSQLLQEIKYSLLETFPQTDIRGDGPVVKVPFATYEFEVCPVFRLTDGRFLNAHTRDGGHWGQTHPVAEINWLKAVDTRSVNKATQLVKMLKAWKRECNVEVRSICLETLAILFVDQWLHKGQSTLYWHDWMVRDFFAWAYQYSTDGIVKPAGIDEWIPAGEWRSKCLSAYHRAVKACIYEQTDEGDLAVDEWKKVFGDQFRAEQTIRPLGASAAARLLVAARS